MVGWGGGGGGGGGVGGGADIEKNIFRKSPKSSKDGGRRVCECCCAGIQCTGFPGQKDQHTGTGHNLILSYRSSSNEI